eukprot:sb/3463396/
MTLNYLRYVWNSPELIRKLVWGALFLGFFIYSFMCCFRSFDTYIKRPTSTKYNMFYEPRKEIRFPAITICNMNPHNRTFLELEPQDPMRFYLSKTWLTPDLPKVPMEEPAKPLFQNFNVKNYYRDSGQRLENFIEKAVFLEENINVSDAFVEKFTTHGLCWTFNDKGDKKVNRTGMDFGLSFSLNINQDGYPDFITTAGLKVMFHNFYEPALIDEYGMALAPGTENYISLSYERGNTVEENEEDQHEREGQEFMRREEETPLPTTHRVVAGAMVVVHQDLIQVSELDFLVFLRGYSIACPTWLTPDLPKVPMEEPAKPLFQNFNVKNYYRDSGQRLENFIEKAVFLEENINVSDAFVEKFTTHGLCWTFNDKGDKKVNRTGMDFGLSFSLNINQDGYPDFITTAGLKVMFHNFYEPALIDEYGMALAPGTENYISLSYERNFPYLVIVMPTDMYTAKTQRCERMCFTMALKEECDCTSYYLPPSGVKECTLFDEGDCVEGVIKKYHAGAYMDKPYCQCQDACVSENYMGGVGGGWCFHGEIRCREQAHWNKTQGMDLDLPEHLFNFLCVLIQSLL